MGPGRAADIIREGLYRGADNGYLITDRKFAGSDTLATSYAISLAIKKLAPYDMIVCGRQAIDGDTAQVGPQAAEKLHIPQVTYAEEIISVKTEQIILVKEQKELNRREDQLYKNLKAFEANIKLLRSKEKLVELSSKRLEKDINKLNKSLV